MPDKAAINEFREIYETADRFAREVGAMRSEVAIPANNELRYSGHHLLQSINEDGTVQSEDHLRKARGHCERAMYEAAEAGIIASLERINAFREDYKDLVVSEVVTDYSEILAASNRANGSLVPGRADRTTVVEHVSKYMETFRLLVKNLERLDASRDDLNAKRRVLAVSHRRFVMGFVLTALGILVTATIGIWRISLM